MASVTGYWGNDNYAQMLTYPVSMNVTMSSNQYPYGKLHLTKVHWRRYNSSVTQTISLYLCDKNGNNEYRIGTINLHESGSDGYTDYNVNCPDLRGKALYIRAKGDTAHIGTFDRVYFTLEVGTWAFSITVTSTTGGTCTCSHTTATPGTKVTLTPTASTGYHLKGYTTTTAAVSNNAFTMPQNNVTIRADFEKTSYGITPKSNPAGAGLVTVSKVAANMGDTVEVTQTPGSAYYFNGWTVTPSSVVITDGAFTMPAAAVTVQANYLTRSTAALSRMDVEGGGTTVLTISAESAAYTHKWQLSFGTGMETEETVAAAGVSSVTIPIPATWSNQLPNSTQKTGGTLTLKTYSGTTLIGTYTLQGIVYHVPASVVPTMSDPAAAIVRTIDNITYADIGNYFVQNHCGVRVTALAAGSRSATIADIQVQISGYSGIRYNKIQTGGSLDFTSGILTIAGNTEIRVTATDSRGRTVTKTATITVQAYNKPAGQLTVWRVDANGDADDTGDYGKYQIEGLSYTQLGTNSLTVTLAGGGDSVTGPVSTGDILPGNRKVFSSQAEFTITLTLTDAFETTTVTAKLTSGRFIIYIAPNGTQMAFMKAVTVQEANLPTGKTTSMEFPDTMQIYIGNETLEDYIQRIAGN